MKLSTTLKGAFILFDHRTGGHTYLAESQAARAQGVAFACPKCFGTPNAHEVLLWSRSRGVPDSALPGPGRWRLVGDLSHLTLEAERTGGPRSVDLSKSCGWHGYINQGDVS